VNLAQDLKGGLKRAWQTAREVDGQTMPKDRLAWVCLGYLYVVWGTSYLANSYVLQSMPPLLMAGLRFTLAGLILFMVSPAPSQPVPTLARWAASGVGVLLLGVGSGGVVYAQQSVDSSLAAISVASVGLWTVVFSRLLGQPVALRDWQGVALGLVGVALVNADGGLQASPRGALALLLGAACWGLGSVLMRHLPMPPGLLSGAHQLLAGGIVLLLAGGLRGERLQAWPSLLSTLAFFYLLIAASLLAFSAYTYLIRHVKPSLATSYAYVNPVVAVVLGGQLADEAVSPQAYLGLGMILLALIFIARGRSS